MKVLSSGFCLSGRFPLWINCPYFGAGAALLSFLKHSHGLLLFTGPTGSGKTTTLYSLVNYAKRHFNRRIVTLEDPVETRDEDVLQVQVNEKAGVTYSAGLKAILRHDPDMIILGKSGMPRRLKSQSARP